MSAFTAKSEFAFDAPAQYSPRAADSYAPRGVSLRGRMLSALQWVAEQPRRRAVINELGSLTDHELADIGLSRGDLTRVFDRDFAAARRI